MPKTPTWAYLASDVKRIVYCDSEPEGNFVLRKYDLQEPSLFDSYRFAIQCAVLEANPGDLRKLEDSIGCRTHKLDKNFAEDADLKYLERGEDSDEPRFMAWPNNPEAAPTGNGDTLYDAVVELYKTWEDRLDLKKRVQN